MKILSWFFALLGVLGLVAVRMLEDKIFYDPFLSYFHVANSSAKMPDFVWGKLILSHIFRFILNLVFSCVIIYFMFKNKQWTIQAGILMILVFAVTFPLYLYCVSDDFKVGNLFSFYIRRFVIQPLILLLIIPLFYYRKQILLNKN